MMNYVGVAVNNYDNYVGIAVNNHNELCQGGSKYQW